MADESQIVPEYKTVKVYVHGGKEYMWEKGESLGLTGEPPRRVPPCCRRS